MLNAKIESVIKDCHSRYSVVVAVARRARQIADDVEARQEILIEKPVNMALNEIADRKIIVVEPKLEE